MIVSYIDNIIIITIVVGNEIVGCQLNPSMRFIIY